MSRMIKRHQQAAQKSKSAVERTGDTNRPEQYAGESGCRTYVGKTDTQGKAVGPGHVCMKPETVIHDGRMYCDKHRPAESRKSAVAAAPAKKLAAPVNDKGRYVTLIQTDKNTLQLIPNTQTIAEFISDNHDHLPTDVLLKIHADSEVPAGRRYNVWGDDETFHELIADFLGNGWQSLNAEDIGALTAAVILEAPDGRIYWHERYQIEAAAEELLLGNTVKFDGAPENRRSSAPDPSLDPDVIADPGLDDGDVDLPKAAGKKAEWDKEYWSDDSKKDGCTCVHGMKCGQGHGAKCQGNPDVKSDKRGESWICNNCARNRKNKQAAEDSMPEAPMAEEPTIMPTVAPTGPNPYQDWKTENLIETIETLTSSDTFAADKPEQESVGQMADVLSARPVEPEPIEGAKAAAIKTAKKYAAKYAGTWLDDLKKTNPELAEAYAITGNQPTWALRNMVKALSIGGINTPEEDKRLAAAKFILRSKRAFTGTPPVNEDTSKVLEGDKSVPDGRDKVEDNTGVTHPKTDTPSKFANGNAVMTNDGRLEVEEGDKSVADNGTGAEDHTGITVPAADDPYKFAAYRVNVTKQGSVIQSDTYTGKPLSFLAFEVARRDFDGHKGIRVHLAEYVGGKKWEAVKEAAVKTAASPESLVLAEEAIDNGDTVAYDVAAEEGQIFGNVKHMRWFREAVADEIEAMGDSYVPDDLEAEDVDPYPGDFDDDDLGEEIDGTGIGEAPDNLHVMSSKKAAADVSTGSAIKLAEKVADKLKALYLEAKPIALANDSRAVRESVEAIYNAMKLIGEAQKQLVKQERIEEEEAKALAAKEKSQKKASLVSNLKLAAVEGEEEDEEMGKEASTSNLVLASVEDEDEDEDAEGVEKEATVHSVTSRAEFRTLIAAKAAKLGDTVAGELGHTLVRTASSFQLAHKNVVKESRIEQQAFFTQKKADLAKRIAGTAGMMGATASIDDESGEVKIAFEDGDSVQIPTL